MIKTTKLNELVSEKIKQTFSLLENEKFLYLELDAYIHLVASTGLRTQTIKDLKFSDWDKQSGTLSFLSMRGTEKIHLSELTRIKLAKHKVSNRLKSNSYMFKRFRELSEINQNFLVTLFLAKCFMNKEIDGYLTIHNYKQHSEKINKMEL